MLKDRSDRADATAKPDKFEKDQAWIKISFPSDWASRTATYQNEVSRDLCGKWKVIFQLEAVSSALTLSLSAPDSYRLTR